MKNIFLIGMPSSGKSTLGKRIADALHYHFLDTDRMIVREEGRSVPEIFAQSGEAYFREAERRVLRTIQPGRSLVVSTGGGMPCHFDNMTYINETGISIFLDVPVDILHRRMVAHGQADRPLFNASDPKLLSDLRQRCTDRSPFYTQANVIVSGETDAEHILRQLGRWL